MLTLSSYNKLELIHNHIFQFKEHFNTNLYHFINGDYNDIQLNNIIYNNKATLTDLLAEVL